MERHLVTAFISSVLTIQDMERVRIKLRYCLPLLVCFFRCLHTSQGTANYFLHFTFCFIFCLIWRCNSDQQSYVNDKILVVVIGYNKVRTFSNIGHRESSDEMWLMNMVEEMFSYLNISKINSAEVQNNGECAFACLKEPMCFSYNLEARASKTGTRVCELLPSDKYNNSDKVIISQKFHHYSIQVSYLKFSRGPCQNYGICVPQYEKNSYVCVCKIGFEGKDCERGEVLNNSDEVIIRQKFNHYSIQVSDLMFNIEKNCTCSRRNAPG